MLSLFELSYFKQAIQNFEEMIEERQKEKGDKIDSIDVITIILYLNQLFCFNSGKCEKANKQLLKVCEQYKEQNENKDSYEAGVYLFGKGIYQFLNTFRDEDNISFLADMEKAYILLDDYKQDILSSLQQMHHIKGNISESEKWGQLLYNLNPKYPGIANNLASLYVDKKQFEEAVKLYSEEELSCPNNHVVLRNLANVYRDMGDTQKEEEYCKRAYEIQPRSAFSCLRYGIFNYKHNKKEEAVKMFNEGISIDSEVLGNYQQLANIAIDDNDFGNAINYLQKCVEISPDEGYCYYKLAECLKQCQRYNEAIDQYNMSIQKQTYKKLLKKY
ncbi:tetratricopeptide repeat protein (macronuclear) [Tetrahymena thermophila SB210]|uniref:Tetratricopeptide repeat protein n=1 Tax=Tetrahymena thermophila (strain SB210) TaxID=312017 RepID=Q239P7_TETTS|nr:tetratricopeptide repeat protein [Tetrahymena thermophila SB210]EAR93268.2 tetratricopeptide repeat protein [Tetrahymena thermophila SB210]|eukprot:XP_001013513.2 tetratricopeptide repeat protein [Tetrahymena thermophila SB210]